MEVNISYFTLDADNKRVPTPALPSQRKFHASKAAKKIFFGGYGTGKSSALAMEILIQMLKYPKNFGLLCRKYYSELEHTTLKEFLDLCPPELIAEHNRGRHVITFKNGSKLIYAGADASDGSGLDKIKSLNLGFVAIDECTEIDESTYLALLGRLRKVNTSRQFFAVSNSSGREWCWERFVSPNKEEDAESFIASSYENKYLPKDFFARMEQTYPKNWISRYIYCGFDDWSGQVFSEFHSMPYEGRTSDGEYHGGHVIPTYLPTPEEQVYIGFDWGIRNPAALLWMSVDYDGVIRVFDEFYSAEKLPEDLANELKRNSYWKNAGLYADPAIFGRERDGRSIADDFNSFDISWLSGNNDILQSVVKINSMFKDYRLLICENCTNLLTEIPKYSWPQLKPGANRNEVERPVDKDNHAIAALRYVINSIQAPAMPKNQLPQWYQDSLNRRKKKFRVGNYSDMSS